MRVGKDFIKGEKEENTKYICSNKTTKKRSFMASFIYLDEIKNVSHSFFMGLDLYCTLLVQCTTSYNYNHGKSLQF